MPRYELSINLRVPPSNQPRVPIKFNFTSGYGSADSLNSAGTGVYENVSKHHSNRNSSEYEDYVNMNHVPAAVPHRQANEMVEEWVDKVQQVEPEYDDQDTTQPPDLPDKPDHSRERTSSARDKLTTRELAATMIQDEDEDYAELPPLPECRQPESPASEKPPTNSNLEVDSSDPISQSVNSEGFDTTTLAQEINDLDLITDKEFERLEREIEEEGAPSEQDLSSKVSSSNDLLINQSVDFPFDDLLDQLDELDEPKNMDRLTEDSNKSELPTDIPTPVSEPESHPSHSSYDMVSQEASPEEPLEHISEKEIEEATENVPTENDLIPTSSTSSSSASSSSTTSSSSSPSSSSSSSPSLATEELDKVTEPLEEAPKPAHPNVARLSSLDKLETWNSGMEESLQFLKEATEEQQQRMLPDQLLLSLGSFEDDSYDLSSTDLHSPPSSSIGSCDSPQSEIPRPAAATKPKITKPVSKLARPSGLAPPSKLAAPNPRSSRSPSNGTLKKCTASKSSDNVSGLPKGRPTSTEGRSTKIQSPYGTLPRNKNRNKPKQTKLTRSRQNSSESPAARSSPSTNSVGGTGLRKNTSRDSSSGLAVPKKTSTLPRPSRSLARPGTGLQKSAGLKVPSSREVVRSRSSSRESIASSGDRDPLRRDSVESATARSSLNRNNPTERSMRRRLLSNETSKAGLPGKRRLSSGPGNKKLAPDAVLRSPSYQNAVSGTDEPSAPKRSTSLRPSGTSSLPGSNSSSPTPRGPAKSRGSTLPTPSSVRSPSRPSPSPGASKLRTLSTSSKTSRGGDDKADTQPKSILKQPKTESKLQARSGLPAPKSGLKAPSSTGLRKPGGIPRPTR